MPHPQEANVKRLLATLLDVASRTLNGRTAPQQSFPVLDPDGIETFETTRNVFAGPEPFGELDAALAAEPAMAELTEIATSEELFRRRFGRYGVGGSIAAPNEFPGIVRHHVILLFQEYVKRENGTEIDPERFERFWSVVKDEIIRETAPALRKLWIANLIVGDRSHKLTPHLILRGVLPRDQAPAAPIGFVLPGHSILEALTTTKVGSAPNTRTQDEDDLDVALELLYRTFAKATLINAYNVYYLGGGGMSGVLPPDPSVANFLDVTDERAARITDFIRLVKEARNNRVVAIAMRRYISARRRQSIEDAFIDYWIALESLFGTGTTELSFRMSLRIAAFLESEPDARSQRFEQASDSYNYRSRLVHGERGTPTTQTLEITAEMVRLSLYKICHSPSSYHLESLEQDVLSGREIATDGLTLVPPLPTAFT